MRRGRLYWAAASQQERAAPSTAGAGRILSEARDGELYSSWKWLTERESSVQDGCVEGVAPPKLYFLAGVGQRRVEDQAIALKHIL